MFSQYIFTRVIVTITRQLPPQDAGVPFFTHTSGSGYWVLVGLVKEINILFFLFIDQQAPNNPSQKYV